MWCDKVKIYVSFEKWVFYDHDGTFQDQGETLCQGRNLTTVVYFSKSISPHFLYHTRFLITITLFLDHNFLIAANFLRSRGKLFGDLTLSLFIKRSKNKHSPTLPKIDRDNFLRSTSLPTPLPSKYSHALPHPHPYKTL